MFWISDFAAAIAFSQLALLGMYFFVRYSSLSSRLIALFCLSLSAYTLASMSFALGQPLVSFILFRLATLAPVLLWLISFSLFVDSGRIHPGVWVAIAFFVLARGVGMGIALFNPEILANNIAFTIIYLVPQIIMLYFSVHSIYLACAGYRIDLVEQRRRIRFIFVLCMGVLLVAILGSDFISLANRILPLEWHTTFFPLPAIGVSLYIFVICVLFSLSVFRLNDDTLTLIPDAASNSHSNEKTLSNKRSGTGSDPGLLARIDEIMEKDRLYTQTGLTISDIATALSMQEYRLRRLINQQMGFRNFNQFLNDYRIKEAAARLEHTNTSISNIALDVGYSTLSVFNKAFRERVGTTPSNYRNQKKSLTPA